MTAAAHFQPTLPEFFLAHAHSKIKKLADMYTHYTHLMITMTVSQRNA